jgi:protocatechuate 3,4-dioxygenase beta subunit
METLAQAASCVLTPNAGEGPFYFDPKLLRSDITDGMPGAPLEIAIQVTRAADCAVLADTRLDLWQADGLGLYSGYENQRGVGAGTPLPVGRTYLRGTQMTDADGWVRFKTIYPSWYGGRTPHMHFKVFVAAREVLAGQAFFDDEVNAEIYGNWDPYREHAAKRRAFNRNDPFIDANSDGNVDGVFCAVERLDGSGVSANAVLTVDT